ncbi:MAG: hypothetical protein EKK65_08285 [Lysobacterales bacterium]|nr:MAG: hypothetical protein EKK65_08285 [Xanthomonadales bacterium]
MSDIAPVAEPAQDTPAVLQALHDLTVVVEGMRSELDTTKERLSRVEASAARLEIERLGSLDLPSPK